MLMTNMIFQKIKTSWLNFVNEICNETEQTRLEGAEFIYSAIIIVNKTRTPRRTEWNSNEARYDRAARTLLTSFFIATSGVWKYKASFLQEPIL